MQFSVNLIDDIRQLLVLPSTQNAFIAGAIVATLGALAGYFMVLRGQSFAGHTLSQVGFPGAAGALLIGAPTLLGLVAFCTAGAVGIAALSHQRTGERRFETAAIGTILVFALALGFAFIRLYHGYADTALAFLLGNFEAISDSQVWMLLAVAAVSVLGLIAIGRPLLFASVDPDVAASRGVPIRLLDTVFLLLLGLAVASCSLLTGTLLVFALLVAPPAAALQFTPRPAVALMVAVGIGIAVTWIGIAVASFTDYPIGFLVTSLAFAAYLLARGGRARRNRVRAVT